MSRYVGSVRLRFRVVGLIVCWRMLVRVSCIVLVIYYLSSSWRAFLISQKVDVEFGLMCCVM